MIFQSLGSNFRPKDVLKHLLQKGNSEDSEMLKKELGERYGGQAFLYYRGRSALKSAVKLACPNGGYVAINGFTCYAVVDAVQSAGADVAFVDIDEDYLHFDRRTLERTLATQKGIKAVIVQNTFGIPCDISAIEKLAKKHKLVLIEDLAHCIGGTYSDGREMGTVGDLVMCSFGRDKVIDIVNGGALIVRKKSLVSLLQPPEKLPTIADQRRDRWYPLLSWKVRAFYPIFLGKLLQIAFQKWGLMVRSADGETSEYTLPDWYSAATLSQLKDLDISLSKRAQITRVYQTYLEQYTPETARTLSFAALRFPLIVTNKQRFLDTVKEAGYHLSDTWYDTPISPERFMKKSGYKTGTCKVAEGISKKIVNLPTHRYMTTREAAYIARCVKESHV